MSPHTISYLRSLLQAQLIFPPLLAEAWQFMTTQAEQIPDHCRRWIIPGAEYQFVAYSFGSIFSQKVIVRGHLFWYHRCTITKAVTLQPESNMLLVTLHYMLTGSAHCRIHGQRVDLIENKYQVYALAANTAYNTALLPGEYESFHLALPYEVIPELAPAYKDLETLLQKLKAGFTGAHHPHLFAIHPRLHECIQEVLGHQGASSDQASAKRAFYREERILRLINFYIADLESWQKEQERLLVAILHITDLEAYITRHLLDAANAQSITQFLPVLLPLMKMTEHRFRTAVHEQYGQSWEEFLHTVRMKRAMELVLKTPYQKLNSIAYLVGYSRPANFTRAFKKYYKHEPGYFRKSK